jgi:hypothetical protein
MLTTWLLLALPPAKGTQISRTRAAGRGQLILTRDEGNGSYEPVVWAVIRRAELLTVIVGHDNGLRASRVALTCNI